MMKRKFCLVLAAITLLCLPAYSSANLVIDDFNDAGGSDLVGSSVVRTQALSLVNGNGLQFFGLNPSLGSMTTYAVSDILSTFGSLGIGTTGVEFTAASATNSSFTARLTSNTGYDSGFIAVASGGPTSPLKFLGDLSTAKILTVTVIGSGGGGGIGVATLGGAFQSIAAVPEPTSLLLVGVALSGMAVRRKRR